MRRIGRQDDPFDQDDSDLAPEGESDIEDPRDKWTGSEMDIERGIVYSDVKRLNIAGFAGLYAMTYFGSEGIRTIESNCLQADRAYVEITKIGEGRYYLDRGLSGYFSMTGEVESDQKKLHWRSSRMGEEYHMTPDEKAAKVDWSKRINSNEGLIYYYDDAKDVRKRPKDQRPVMLELSDDDSCFGFTMLLTKIADADMKPIVPIHAKLRPPLVEP